RFRSERDRLLIVLGAKHPEILKAEGQIAAAQTTLNRLKNNPPPQPEKPDVRVDHPAVVVAEQPAMAQVKSQLEANRVELENLSKDESRIRTDIERYQNRLSITPVREQQLTGIMRDYELQKLAYADLLNKEQQSQLATNM